MIAIKIVIVATVRCALNVKKDFNCKMNHVSVA